jgi:hypothetical protein
VLFGTLAVLSWRLVRAKDGSRMKTTARQVTTIA